MDQFIVLVSSFAVAREQLALLIIGALVMLSGGFFFGYDAYWHIAGRRVKGVLSGVNVSAGSAGEMYYPIYEYADERGAKVQATSGSGSNVLTGWLPGRQCILFVHPHDPATVTPAGLLMPIIGLILFAFGVGLVYTGFAHYRFNIITAALTCWLLSVGALKLRKIIKPRELQETKEQFLARKRPDLRILSDAELCERLRARPKASGMVDGIVCILAVALIGLGVYLSHNTALMLATGMRVRGEVVGMESSYSTSSHSYTYNAMVAFNAGDGNHRFRDSIGANPPLFSTGQTVTVIYNPGNPQKAMVDHGFGNWVGPAICFAGALVLLLMASASISSRRRAQAFLQNHQAFS